MNNILFDPVNALGRLTYRAAGAMRADLANNLAEAGFDVSVEQWTVLMQLRLCDGQTQSELAENMLQEKTGVSRLVKGLEREAFLRRVPDRRDGRRKRVHLTDKGRRVVRDSQRQARQTLDKAQQGISETDLDVCRRVLAKVFANMTGKRDAFGIGRPDVDDG